MSRARLNIWLRFPDCSLITTCWRTDLVIKTCGGQPLVKMDPTLIEQLKNRYNDFDIVQQHFYEDEERIMLQPDRGTRRRFHQIEVDVPPGCYVVWTRVCFGDNEETNKVMVIADCGQEVCVNLILNDVKTCAKELLHPLAERLAGMDLPDHDIEAAIRAMMAVVEKPRRVVLAELEQRLEDAKGAQDPELPEAIARIMRIVEGMRRDDKDG